MRLDLIIPKAAEYQDFIETKIYKHWWKFTNRSFSPNSIFRGHSNYKKHSISEIGKLRSEIEKSRKENEIDERHPEKKNFSVWQTQSAFHRQFVDCEFWGFYSNYRSLLENIDLYKTQLEPFVDENGTKDLTVLQLLQLFQHYGISTPLIDFTKNKDTALYFAYSDLFDSGVMHDIAEDCGNRFITIVEVRLDVLLKYKMIETITDTHFNSSFDLESGVFYYYDPKIRLKNKNIDLQEGSFIYLDSEMSMEEYIQNELIKKKGSSGIPNPKFRIKPIVWHIIPYSSVDFFSRCRIERKDYSLFAYLLAKKKLGLYLFTDIKGIERDMKNSNINFQCIANPNKCECLKKLLQSKVCKELSH